jgi:hypothetical protein
MGLLLVKLGAVVPLWSKKHPTPIHIYPQHENYTAGADPGFCVRGDESRRGVWGPLKVSSGFRAEPW